MRSKKDKIKKMYSFLAYGFKFTNTSKEVEITEKEANKLIKNYYDIYPDLKELVKKYNK